MNVEVRGITKRFPGVVANDDVNFEATAGEVHALLGENGAGKSTLSHILSGLYRPDEGEIRLDGEPVQFHSPRDAIEAGVCMVHQHFRLVDRFTVAENLILGDRRGAGRSFRLDPGAVHAQVRRLGERYRLPVDPRARIWQLSVGERQRVEILKALYEEARVLILDEPTAVLTPDEASRLFETLREIVAVAGVAGNGPLELAEAIAGLRRATQGSVRVGGRAVAGARAAHAAGLGYVPEDRLGTGVAPNLSIAMNIDLKSYREGPLFLRLGRMRERAQRAIDTYAIKAPGPDAEADTLSGGNIQKVVLAREFAGNLKALIAASPTRGLDVSAVETVHRHLVEAADRGVGVLLISEDLDEILALADRVLVMYEGRLTEAPRDDVDRIGVLMAGGN